ncbi:acyl-CoA carboxylase epsilon subunit [Streptomyces sp. HNM0645]|uniref:acyl-CoA carboxylase epsilon subunit n=1 Tax=Streptomyces sp. HNM0645 TaxID=2782343 RepID=UPI0024B741BE|nr:acyl-CoA carboxylase epsilon subunit [Streptomyces sp. HNM0645]MDI9889484.1 acyl-CoA carboxylase epsilon subunit [Streptomyces sp. HNM0645]
MPPIKVLYGQPTPEELAALLAVLQARTATATAPEPPDRSSGSSWADPATATALRRLPLPVLVNHVFGTPHTTAEHRPNPA